MTQAQALLRLQDIELAIRQKRKRLQEIESILNDNAAVIAAKQNVEKVEAELKPLRTRLRDLELEVKANETKQKSTEDKLYSGTVKNPKELTDLQREIEALKNWRTELENRMLELMMEIEDVEASLDAAQATLQQMQETEASKHQALIDEKQALEQAIAESMEQYRAAQASIDEDALKIYKEMRPQKGYRPVAALDGQNCGVCGVAQTTATLQAVRHGNQLVYCSNCGRILATK
ncbi:MAG: hypothetical protein D6712_14710 [Chloroflexi bacterium]|nr:MAG: hypothetical protein D6712_14710 [Chloroflexota bacterium]